QNEKRQSENQPYGQAWEKLMKALYPASHPYHHSVIGSMNVLDAASIEDVHALFGALYGPNNAVLVLAGDIDLTPAKDKVAKYFGHIPAGPDMAQPAVDVARRAEATRETMHDKLPQARIYRVWTVAEVGHDERDRLQRLQKVLGGCRSWRLGARLLQGDQLVDSISAGVYAKQLGWNFILMANVKQGVDQA